LQMSPDLAIHRSAPSTSYRRGVDEPMAVRADTTGAVQRCALSPFAIFAECPQCAGEMRPEHAHYRCAECGWRDSCCD
jgi:hypothetical protein